MRHLPLLALCLLLLSAPAAAQCAEEPPLQHWTGAGTTVCPCFVPGEVVGAVFQAPAAHYPIEILRIGVGWGSVLGGSPQSLEQALLIYPSGLPDPGAPQFSLGGPVLTDGVINEYDIAPIPNGPGTDRIVTSGPFTVGLQLLNQSPPLGPAPVHDGNGCQPGKNVVFAIPGGWSDACNLGVSGDWLFHVVYRRVNCGPTQYTLSVSNLVGGQVATLDVTSATPSAMTWVAASGAGLGNSPVPALNVVLGIRNYKLIVAPQPTNAFGAASWNRSVPARFAGRTIWFQSAQHSNTSNIVQMAVN